MPKIRTIGVIGQITVQLDTSDPAKPVLILNDNAQAERLAALLSPDPNKPLDLDWRDSRHPDDTVIRIPYTPDVDRRVADIINIMGKLYFDTPELARNKAK